MDYSCNKLSPDTECGVRDGEDKLDDGVRPAAGASASASGPPKARQNVKPCLFKSF